MLFKKELCITTSLDAQVKIRQILKDNGIRYEVESMGQSFGEYREVARITRDIVYCIYVKKSSYEEAKNLIRSVNLAK